MAYATVHLKLSCDVLKEPELMETKNSVKFLTSTGTNLD